MATIKVIFMARPRDGREGVICYRIIQRRGMRMIQSGFRILHNEWDSDMGKILLSPDSGRREYLSEVRKKLEEDVERLRLIVAALENSGHEYSAADVVAMYRNADAVTGFFSFARKVIADDRRMGRCSEVEHLSATINSLIRFHGDKEIPFHKFDSGLMSAYECYLRSRDIRPNTISFYMRKLRAIYNRAVESGMTAQCNPFRHVYTGIAKTKKRAVSIEIIKALRNMDLTVNPLSQLARDMFLFSFYTRGMSMVDMSYLLKTDLNNGVLSYRRKKTNQQLYIRWESKMQEIVERYTVPDSDFLLPMIKSGGKDYRRQYRNAQHMLNRRLKKLGSALGMSEPLTMYCARHAWASIAHDNNVPLSVISQGMGHDSERTTRIYLASLSTSVVDNANNKIIKLLDL